MRTRAAGKDNKNAKYAFSQKFGIILTATATVVLIFLGALGGVARAATVPAFAPETSINGIDISGLSFEEGERRVLEDERDALAKVSLPVSYNGASQTFGANELGVSTNAKELLNEAYLRNKAGTLPRDFNLTYIPFHRDTELVLDEAKLKNALGRFLNERDVPAENAAASFDTANREFVYTNETTGHMADVTAVVNAVKDRLIKKDYSTFAVSDGYVDIVKPAVTAEVLAHNTVLIGRAVTLATNDEDRNTNIRLMCEAVDGLMLQPDETLSLNDLVGQRTEEKGFKAAAAIVDGQLTDSIGGGICQLAGTLYNAALYADMEIVERVHHTWPSEYLPIGLDATLNWDNKDLKIKNRSGFPIYITATMQDLVVTVEIYGQQSPDGLDIEVENVIFKEIPSPDPVLIYTDELPAGTRRTKVRSRKGYEVVTYRHYLKDGVVVKSELLYQDHFRAMRGTVLVGTDEIIK
ncbi:MAG TPA: VanW family protein [Feifaniaceae bacterium]|nr:VanW family protein [Feifaniaceae bacterium]